MRHTSIAFGLLLIVLAAVVGIEIAGSLVTSSAPIVPITISCTLPGITCGSFKIDSANLTVGTSNANGTLSIALTNTSSGTDGNSTTVTYFINSEELGQSQGVPDNQTVIYVLQVPPLYGLVSGASYVISAETIIGGSTLMQNITTVAK